MINKINDIKISYKLYLVILNQNEFLLTSQCVAAQQQ